MIAITTNNSIRVKPFGTMRAARLHRDLRWSGTVISFRLHGNTLENFRIVATGPNPYNSTRKSYGNNPGDFLGIRPVWPFKLQKEKSGCCPDSRNLVKILDKVPAIAARVTPITQGEQGLGSGFLLIFRPVDAMRQPRLTALNIIVVSLALVIQQKLA